MLAIIVGIFSVSCDNPTPNFGIFLHPDGIAEIIYKPCNPDTLVYRLSIQQNNEAIWEIASNGPQNMHFPLGETSPGFNTIVPLKSLAQGRVTIVFSTSELDTDSEVVQWSDLEQESVLVPRRGVESREQFDQRDGLNRPGFSGGSSS